MLITKSGFDYGFDPKACESCRGNCCIGESGYIWVSADEIVKIAEFLNISLDKFYDLYLKKIKYKFSLKEIEYNSGFKCIFFDEKRRACQIYPVRPSQCRTFPFWDYFKENIKELEDECPGIVKL